MHDFKNKTTIFIIVALVLVCGGSFIGVKALNKNAKADTGVSQSYNSSSKAEVQSTSAPVLPDSPTHSVSNLVGTPSSQVNSTSAESTTKTAVPTTNEPATTTKPFVTQEATTTTNPVVTNPTTSIPTTEVTENPYQNTTEPQSVIENAALFDNGFLSYQFNPNGDFYYTNGDPWQRNFGFNELYDMAAPFTVMYYDTMRCKFEYDNKDWMIQFWKGQYGWVFVGHEIGVYTKPKDRTLNHYDCATDEEALYMSMTGYRKGEEIFTREYGKYWWCTGFVPGKLDSFADRSELSMSCRITAKDYKMLLAFCGALQENGMVQGQNYTTNGLDVFITW